MQCPMRRRRLPMQCSRVLATRAPHRTANRIDDRRSASVTRYSSKEVVMTCIIDINSKRHLSTKLATGVAISALLVLGMSLASANAEDHRDDHRGGDHHGDWH